MFFYHVSSTTDITHSGSTFVSPRNQSDFAWEVVIRDEVCVADLYNARNYRCDPFISSQSQEFFHAMFIETKPLIEFQTIS